MIPLLLGGEVPTVLVAGFNGASRVGYEDGTNTIFTGTTPYGSITFTPPFWANEQMPLIALVLFVGSGTLDVVLDASVTPSSSFSTLEIDGTELAAADSENLFDADGYRRYRWTSSGVTLTNGSAYTIYVR